MCRIAWFVLGAMLAMVAAELVTQRSPTARPTMGVSARDALHETWSIGPETIGRAKPPEREIEPQEFRLPRALAWYVWVMFLGRID